MIERSVNFTANGFPVDVLWMDIEYSQEKEYFVFDYERFSQRSVMQMNTEIEEAQRRMVVICDPHVRASDEYFVYRDGMAI